MKLRNPKLISCVSWVAEKVIRSWVGTIRSRYLPMGPSVVPAVPGLSEQYIYTFWHDSLLLLAKLYGECARPVSVLISQHSDGQLIAETAQRLGYRPLRGSSTRGGVEAMRELLRASRTNHIAITPDGPKGPRHVMQSGAVFLASRTGLPIVPVAIGYDKPWRAKSWDRFAVPRPFTRAVVVTGEPIRVPLKADAAVLEQYRVRVQIAVDEANAFAESQFMPRPVLRRNAA